MTQLDIDIAALSNKIDNAPMAYAAMQDKMDELKIELDKTLDQAADVSRMAESVIGTSMYDDAHALLDRVMTHIEELDIEIADVWEESEKVYKLIPRGGFIDRTTGLVKSYI